MGYSLTASATCPHCGATYHAVTVHNKDMRFVVKAWKKRHKIECEKRTPADRRKFAKRKRKTDAITFNFEHPGMVD